MTPTPIMEVAMATNRKMTSSSARLKGCSQAGRQAAGSRARIGLATNSAANAARPGIAGTLSVIWQASVRISAWQTHQPQSPVNTTATTQVRTESPLREAIAAGARGGV